MMTGKRWVLAAGGVIALLSAPLLVGLFYSPYGVRVMESQPGIEEGFLKGKRQRSSIHRDMVREAPSTSWSAW